MDDFEKIKITESEKEKYRISNLPDRPNAFSSYRKNKMSAGDVKKTFDAQMDFLARKHNELVETFAPMENERANNENTRIDNENERVKKEEDRVDNENKRVDNENKRVEKENERVEKENERVDNEEERMKVIGDLSTALEKLDGILAGEASILTYPIGSVYISFESDSPARWYGGSWMEIESGRFLMSGSNAGLTGGSEDMVAWIQAATISGSSSAILWEDSDHFPMTEVGNRGAYVNDLAFEPEVAVGHSSGVKVTGGEDTSNCLPPYITVHMWRRIA